MIWNQTIDMTGLTNDDIARTRTVKSTTSVSSQPSCRGEYTHVGRGTLTTRTG
jgi:hypothetical protein